MTNNQNLLEETLDKLNDIGNAINNCLESNCVNALEKDLLKQKLAHTYDLVLQLETSSAVDVEESHAQDACASEEVEKGHEQSDSQAERSRSLDPSREKEAEQEERHEQDGHAQNARASKESHELETRDSESELFELDSNSEAEQKKVAIKEKIIEETKRELNQKKDQHNLNDSFEGKGKHSLHDEFTKKFQRSDLSSKLQASAIHDIHKAINLNDQFNFIKDIFNSNADAYKNTIDVLNTLPNFNEAFIYLKSHVEADMNSESVQQLLNLVRRKFITNNNE